MRILNIIFILFLLVLITICLTTFIRYPVVYTLDVDQNVNPKIYRDTICHIYLCTSDIQVISNLMPKIVLINNHWSLVTETVNNKYLHISYDSKGLHVCHCKKIKDKFVYVSTNDGSWELEVYSDKPVTELTTEMISNGMYNEVLKQGYNILINNCSNIASIGYELDFDR